MFGCSSNWKEAFPLHVITGCLWWLFGASKLWLFRQFVRISPPARQHHCYLTPRSFVFHDTNKFTFFAKKPDSLFCSISCSSGDRSTWWLVEVHATTCPSWIRQGKASGPVGVAAVRCVRHFITRIFVYFQCMKMLCVVCRHEYMNMPILLSILLTSLQDQVFLAGGGGVSGHVHIAVTTQWQGRIQREWGGGAIGAITPLKPMEVTLFTMIFYNSENNISDWKPFCRPLFCHSSVVQYTASLLQWWNRYETWPSNISWTAPPSFTGWLRPFSAGRDDGQRFCKGFNDVCAGVTQAAVTRSLGPCVLFVRSTMDVAFVSIAPQWMWHSFPLLHNGCGIRLKLLCFASHAGIPGATCRCLFI